MADHRTTEITLYLRGGHQIHLATAGLDDHTIPQMRNDLKERWTAATAEPDAPAEPPRRGWWQRTFGA